MIADVQWEGFYELVKSLDYGLPLLEGCFFLLLFSLTFLGAFHSPVAHTHNYGGVLCRAQSPKPISGYIIASLYGLCVFYVGSSVNCMC